ncbi:hypothetical protein E5P55_01015 [Candidatus Pinguicoccus supinus]|uniref:RNA polymerase alpha subunit C-terminal domain-containing protein n=1 Tax=Candidatus Pinguicoccus supinus TaxID=2529394 RepID=A0A7T0BRM8_9BACT|nr:hypothetical protein E5P55_01015 [Candidatus Pinguicoccus supinus]
MALNEAILLLKNYLNVFKISYGKNSNKYISNSTYENEELIKSNKILNILNTSVNEIELSVRSINCLNSANITTVGELCSKTETDMLKYKNFGKKSLLEIKNKLKQFNLKLGMSFADKI